MISKRLIQLFSLSVVLFILHGTEEYLMGFYNTYPLLHFKWTNSIFSSIPQATFATFQVMWALGLLVAALLLISQKGRMFFLSFMGLIYIYELTHILSAVLVGSYTPGLCTSFLFIPMNYFYWKELLKNRRINVRS